MGAERLKIEQMPLVDWADLQRVVEALIDARVMIALGKALPGGRGSQRGLSPRALRVKYGKSVADVCALGDLDRHTVIHYEDAKIRNPRMSTMTKIAAGIGCTVQEYRDAVAQQMGSRFQV